jgi:hypothetical protein
MSTQDERSFFDKLFPHPTVEVTRGKIEESGSGHTLPNGKHTRERWVQINGRIFIGADETLYQASYGDDVSVASDIFGRVLGYKNHTSGMHSEASSTSAVGAIALAVLLATVAYLGGIWNFIWKGFDIWWLTIIIITFFSLYALVWTPMYVTKELRRQKLAHEKLRA